MKPQPLPRTSQVLSVLQELGKMLPLPFETPYAYVRRATRNYKYDTYTRSLGRLEKRGLVKTTKQNDKKFISLTNKGQLELLLQKARLSKKPTVWDKKWRLCTFDIPEQAKERRSMLRYLLRKNGFMLLQNSVFISPYPLNHDAVDYLNKSGLKKYIRIMRVDKMDDDRELKKKYRFA